jgi:hypothetical protein
VEPGGHGAAAAARGAHDHGSRGETLAPATADVPRGVQLVGGGIDTLLSLALLVLAAAAVTRWRTARSEAAAV